MDDVAATLLLEEATHLDTFPNQKRRIGSEQVDKWEETNLLIVDKKIK